MKNRFESEPEKQKLPLPLESDEMRWSRNNSLEKETRSPKEIVIDMQQNNSQDLQTIKEKLSELHAALAKEPIETTRKQLIEGYIKCLQFQVEKKELFDDLAERALNAVTDEEKEDLADAASDHAIEVEMAGVLLLHDDNVMKALGSTGHESFSVMREITISLEADFSRLGNCVRMGIK